jgi:hypothetical protein
MTAFSQIETSTTEPTIAAVAAAIVKQVTAVSDGRTGFGLYEQIEALIEAKARVESRASIAAFVRGFRVEDGEDYLGAYFEHGHSFADDERPVQLVWADNANGCVYLHGMVIDAGAEYGTVVIWSRDHCTVVFGETRVLARERAETLRRQERKAAQWG